MARAGDGLFARVVPWVVALSTTLVAGCDSPVPVDDPTVGRATARAIEVHGRAAGTARAIADEPNPACRVDIPDGPVLVRTSIYAAQKTRRGPTQRWRETRTWRRDDAGDIAARRELLVTLPDGRVQPRTMETRVVDGRPYRALDDRFVDATRVPGIDDQVAADATDAVDDILGLVTIDRGLIVAAEPGRGLCRRPATPLPDPADGELVWADGVRRGWLRFEDGDSALLVLHFSEQIGEGSGDVVAPAMLYDVDPDRSYAAVGSFVEQGVAEGWLAPPVP